MKQILIIELNDLYSWRLQNDCIKGMLLWSNWISFSLKYVRICTAEGLLIAVPQGTHYQLRNNMIYQFYLNRMEIKCKFSQEKCKLDYWEWVNTELKRHSLQSKIIFPPYWHQCENQKPYIRFSSSSPRMFSNTNWNTLMYWSRLAFLKLGIVVLHQGSRKIY